MRLLHPAGTVMARRAQADDAVPGRGLRARARRQGGIAGASRPILPPGCRGRCLSLVCSPRAAAPTLALGRPIETRAGPFRTPDRVRHGVSARGRTLRKAVPLHVPPTWEMSTDPWRAARSSRGGTCAADGCAVRRLGEDERKQSEDLGRNLWKTCIAPGEGLERGMK